MSAPSTVLEVTDANFAQAVLTRSNSQPVVVDFWAAWCGPCRILGPIIEKVAAEYDGLITLAKLNTDENPRTATTYRIQGIPAVKAFKAGKLASEFTGSLPEPQVRAFFKKLAPPPGSDLVTEGHALKDAGDLPAAAAKFRSALELDKNSADAIVGLASVLLQKGDEEEAKKLLTRVPADRRANAMGHQIFLRDFADKHATEDLEGEANANPRDPRARYRYGLLLAAKRHWEPALDELIESVRLDKNFADGAARKGVLAVFDILGMDDPLTRDYQRTLSQLLF